MSYSVLSFEKEEMYEMKVETLGYETNSLTSALNKRYRELMRPFEKIKSVKVIDNCKDSFVSEITLIEWVDACGFEYGTRVFVCYHHAGDPSLFEVIVEVGKILKELENLT